MHRFDRLIIWLVCFNFIALPCGHWLLRSCVLVFQVLPNWTRGPVVIFRELLELMPGISCLYESQCKEVILVPLSRTPALYILCQFIHIPQRFRGDFFPLTQLLLKLYFADFTSSVQQFDEIFSCWVYSPNFLFFLLLIRLLIFSKNSCSTVTGSFTCFGIGRCSKSWQQCSAIQSYNSALSETLQYASLII